MFWRRRHEVRDEDLSAYVDGELSSTSLDRVETHLESCTACREAVVELRAVHEAVSGLPPVRAPRSFTLREADVAGAAAVASHGPFASAMPLLSGVAAIAIVAFVVLAGVDVTSENTSGDFAGQAAQESLPLSAATEDGARFEQAEGGIEDAEGDLASPPGIAEPGDEYTGEDAEPNGFAFGDDGELLPQEGSERNAPVNSRIGQGADDEDGNGLRIAEGVAAAVAIAAGGAALFIWWRRRQSDSI